MPAAFWRQAPADQHNKSQPRQRDSNTHGREAKHTERFARHFPPIAGNNDIGRRTDGYDRSDSSIPENSSLYDQVLDVTWQLGAIPQAFFRQERIGYLFALARGDQDVPPLEMTKWFDMNYHYLVPEIGPDTPISFANDHLVQRFVEAKNAGTLTRPVVVGPVTYLALAKAADDAPEGFEPLDRIDDVVTAYRELVSAFGAAGATWVQFDEPRARLR